MIYIIIGVAALAVGFGFGYFVQIKWGHREKIDGTLLINHQLRQVHFNVDKDIEALEDGDILTIRVAYADSDADIIIRDIISNDIKNNIIRKD